MTFMYLNNYTFKAHAADANPTVFNVTVFNLGNNNTGIFLFCAI